MAITDPDALNKIKPTSDGRDARMLDIEALKKRVNGYMSKDVITGSPIFDAAKMADDFVIMLKMSGNPTKAEVLRKVGALYDAIEVKSQRLIIQ